MFGDCHLLQASAFRKSICHGVLGLMWSAALPGAQKSDDTITLV